MTSCKPLNWLPVVKEAKIDEGMQLERTTGDPLLLRSTVSIQDF